MTLLPLLPSNLSRGKSLTSTVVDVVCDFVVTFLVISLLIPPKQFIARSQTSSNSLPMFNVALNRPITVLPADVSCGSQVPTVFCQSTESQDSQSNCLQDICSSLCPWRSATPSPTFLLRGALGIDGSCVRTDPVNLSPSSTDQSSVTFVDVGTQCYLTPRQPTNEKLVLNSSVTLTLWLWPSSGSGTVIERNCRRKDGTSSTTFTLQVSRTGFTFGFNSSRLGYLEEVIPADLPLNAWSFLALQIHSDKLSVFLNSTNENPTVTSQMKAALEERDCEGTEFRIGQDFTGKRQFIGRMQDFRFYNITLSNREIIGVYTGTVPKVRIQSECFCPGQYPRVENLECFGNDRGIKESVRRVNPSSHVLEMANDGDFTTFFMTNPVQEVTVEIDFGDIFEIFFVKIMFYSPLPDWLKIEKTSEATGVDFKEWQYYARDCLRSFDMMTQSRLVNSSSVNCLQLDDPFMPLLSGGSVTFNLLNPDRPGHQNPEQTPELVEFMRANRIRLTMSGHLSGLSLRHSYFGIYEIEVLGRCDCNGHGSSCNVTNLPYFCSCRAASNTEGDKCQRCKPLYNSKPFTRGSPCQPCECNNHSQSCSYVTEVDPFPNESELGGGGVCNDCQDNTEGHSCQSCVTKFYRPEGISLSAKNVCQPCNCSSSGAVGGCEKIGGQCACKANVEGRLCDRCKAGFFNLQPSNPVGCEDCSCNMTGSAGWAFPSYQCQEPHGQCPCKTYVEGVKCDRCMPGFYGLDASDPNGCRPCNCNAQRSLTPTCHQITGQCQCRENLSGLTCDTCIDNFYLVATLQVGSCRQCNCEVRGTVPGSFCNKLTGSCVCQPNVIGSHCNTCRENYFNLTSSGCQECRCDLNGVANPESVCDVITGVCKCRQGVEGPSCNRCKSGYYNATYRETPPGSSQDPCVPCNCNASGTSSCDPDTGKCSCRPNRTGTKCDKCLDGYFADGSGACKECVCNESGSISNSPCDPFTGQCQCKKGGSGIGGLSCDGCLPSFWGFDDQLGRCRACDCDPSGSHGNACDATTGQCSCKELTTGRQCNLCTNGTSGLSSRNPFGCSKAPGGVTPVKAKELSSKFIFLVWDPPSQPNGVLESYNLLRNRVAMFNSSYNVTEYNDTSVKPYTKYTYVLTVQNDFGQTQSAPVTYETLQDIPSGSLDPKILETSSRQIKISWKAPESANGVIIKFVVRQLSGFNDKVQKINDSMPYAIRFQGLAFQAIIDSLTPFSNVTFDLQSCTSNGCLSSQPVSTITSEDAPANQDPPTVLPINSSILEISWLPPKQPNGVIISYELWTRKQVGDVFNQPTLVFHTFGQYNPLSQSFSSLDPPAVNYTVGNLEPYTYYAFKVVSENSRGKTESKWGGNTTGEAMPTFVSTPNVTSINSSSVDVSWTNRSSKINGILRSQALCYTFNTNETWPWKCMGLSPNTSSYTLSDLKSFTNVTILLTACNSVACKNSSYAVVTIPPSAPAGLLTPVLMPRNSTSLLITWSPPEILNGPTPFYLVVRSSPSFNNPPQPVEAGEGIVPLNGIGYYKLPADTLPQDSFYTGIKFMFRTSSSNGLIFFAATPATQIEYLAIYLESGELVFNFNTQDCPTVLKWTEGPLDTNTWQTVTVLRLGNYASIQMNQGQQVYTNVSCSNQMIGQNSGLYVGGLPKEFVISDFSSLRAFNFKNFCGCLANLTTMIQGPPLKELWNTVNWQKAEQSENNMPMWMGCRIDQHSGIRFFGTGYLTVSINSLNGRSLTDVFFIFKTQSQNGLILFAYGAIGSYYAIYMWEGLLNWNVSINGVLTSYVYNATALCDGRFHPIRFVIDLPSGFMELNVDGNKYTQQLTNDRTSRMAGFILSSYLHVGGISKDHEVTQFMHRSGLQWLSKYHFSGCIDPALRIASGQILSSGKIVGGMDVDMSGCPSSTNDVGCQSERERFKIVYNGSDSLSFLDSGLEKFTEYMYNVHAINSGGSAESQWTLSRTLEGAPLMVPSPKVEKLSKGQLLVTWSAPDSLYYTGSITNYIVKLYCYTNPTVSNASVARDKCSENETIVSGNQLSALVTFTLPFTIYEVKLMACTRGGCGESNETLMETDPDAPSDVRPPFVLSNGPSHIVVGWFYPGRVNGEIVGFTLNMRGSSLYSGLLTSYNVTDLSVFTSYVFNVMVCNTVKCTTSDDVQLMTSQLPPTSVEQPLVTLIDARKIKIDWTRPSQSNGILKFYLIHLSQLSDKAGDVAYNSSDGGVTTTYLGDLTPDVTYFISVSACTGAGCTRSNSSVVKMPEGVPEEVPDPVVITQGPTQLNVSWSAPGKPNGIILNYLIMQDKHLLANVSSPAYRLVSGLQPWSEHIFQVKVCTIKGCSQSSEVVALTSEAPPEGAVHVEVVEVSDRGAPETRETTGDIETRILNMNLVLKKVRAKWNPIQQPNSLATYSLFFDGPFYDLEGPNTTPLSFDFRKKSSKRNLFSTNSTLTSGSWVTVGHLLPHTNYTSYVNVSNTVGFVLSNYVTMTTSPSEPDGVKPPLLSSTSPISILASWTGPLIWNSNEEPLNQLQFKATGTSDDHIVNVFSSPTSATSYLKSDLLPFTSYSFRLVAINGFGSKFSDWVELVTRQDVPSGLDTPTLLNITSRSVTLSWQPPSIPNGLIVSYEIFQSNGANKSFSEKITKARLDGLIPFNNYTFALRACTVAGCTDAKPTNTFTTFADAPEGVSISTIGSPSSGSVLLTWRAPIHPNGVIVRYELWRMNLCSKNSTDDVGSFSVDGMNVTPILVKVLSSADFGDSSEPFAYLDESSDILPYTCYQYQLKVFNHKYSTSSDWVTITTKSARPSGLAAPAAFAYNSTSARIIWYPPKRLNGLLTSYVVSVGFLIHIQVLNTSLNSLDVFDLAPYTKYNVSITACTDGGCTESPRATVETEPSTPAGLLPPMVAPVSQSHITISWSKPSHPNGRVSKYELLRSTISQPLIDDPVGVGKWFSVATGDLLTFEDTRLDTFTTYIYRLSFFNGYGLVLSENSSAVTTFGGIPKKLPEINITIFNISLVRLFWEVPVPKVIQGRIENVEVKIFKQNFDINSTLVNSTNLTRSSKADEELPSHIDLTRLRPLTSYWVTTTFTMFGGARYDADAVNFTMPDGVPENLSPPTFKVINDSSIQIFWEEPKVPKGAIVAYYILLNDHKIDPNTNQSGSYTLNNLKPYTVYNISIEACTEYACTFSLPSIATTSESAPEFMKPPKVVEDHLRHLQISWDPPERRNGIILAYELYKMQKYASCIRLPSTNAERCKYILCDALHSFCGDQCYSGYKICCNGRLHSIKAGYECCGTSYIPRRQNESDVCCGGEFHKKKDNFRCCSGWYVKVLPGEICCKDPGEDRIVVDYGDVCCGSLPYRSGEAQLCCGGQLHSRLNKQCCGNKVIDSSLVCCHGYKNVVTNIDNDNESLTSDGLSHKWYANREEFICCGLDYVPRTSSICCTDEVSGRWKVYNIPSSSQSDVPLMRVQKCCGLELTSDSLGCCGGFSYNQQQETCASVDSSGVYSDCGTGKICPKNTSDLANICDTCGFDSVRKRCHIAKKLPPLEEESVDELEDALNLSDENDCYAPQNLIYSGLNLSFIDKNVLPYTRYSYHVIAINSVGISTSNVTNVTTLPGIPEDVQAPEFQTNPANPFYIILSWHPPVKPNGPILWYAVLRDSLEISRVSTEDATSTGETSKHTYLDDNAVVPFRMYNYAIRACTLAGCNSSRSVRCITKQGSPDEFALPTVKNVNSTALEIKWKDPVKPNGFITRYILSMMKPKRMKIDIWFGGKLSNDGSDPKPTNHSYVVADLSPFTTYHFNLTICTEAGCTTSDTFSGKTLTGIPSGLQPPLLLFVGPTPTVEISWLPPAFPNGDLLQVGVERSFGGLSFERIFLATSSSTPSVLAFNDSDISLGGQYIYRIYYSNSAGFGFSPQTAIFVPNDVFEVLPEIVSTSGISDTSISITWSTVKMNEKSVYPGSYNLLLITNNMIFSVITQRSNPSSDLYSLNITNLKPYTSYIIRIQACNSTSGACGTSPSQAKLRTKPAAPLGLAPPVVKSLDSHSILISWDPPELTNGPLDKYLLYRSNNLSRNQPSNSPALNQFFPSEIMIANVLSNVTEYLDASREILPYSTYKYRIVAVGVAGEVSSDSTSVQTLEAPPEFQLEPEVSFVSSVEAEACWDPPVKPNGFVVEYILTYKLIPDSSSKETGGSPSIFVRLNGTTLCANVSGLTPFKNYTARVTASNRAGSTSSSWSPPITTFQSSPSGVEPPLSEAIIGGKSVILTWKEPQSPNGILIYYKVYLKIAPSSNANISQKVTSVVVYKGLNLIHEAGSLEPFTRYLTRLEACTAFGCSRSRWREFVTSSGIPPNPPEVVRPPLTSYSSVALQWTIPAQTYGPLSRLEVFRSSSSLFRINGSTNRNNGMNNDERTRVKRSTQEEAFELIYALELHGNSSPRTFSYDDMSVLPYKLYRYFLRMSNKAGYIDSLKVEAVTPQAPPTFVAPPSVELIPFQFDRLLITWTAPTNPNGIIHNYQLNRSDLFFSWYFPSNSSLRFVDAGLMAYTVYMYAVTSCSEGGCTSSNFTSQRTSETAPGNVDPPQIVAVSSSSLTVNWSVPRITNGQINRYELRVNSLVAYSGLNTSFEKKDLTPHTLYSISLVACTPGGCTESAATTAITDQAPPLFIDPPQLVIMSAESIKVTWKSPVQPNGPLVLFELRRNGTLIDMITPEKVEGNGTNSLKAHDINSKTWTFLDKNLSPATTYSYEVTAYNPVGKVSSQSSTATTPSSAPAGVQPPTLRATSSTTVLASWKAPFIPNGVIVNYGLYLSSIISEILDSPSTRVKRDAGVTSQGQSPKLVYRGLGLSTNITGLEPFSRYSLSLQACTSVGCSFSEESQVDTLVDVPKNQQPPELTSFFNDNNSKPGFLPEFGVQVAWKPPDKMNGLLVQYMLYRRLYIPEGNRGQIENLLYAGPLLNFTDLDPALIPFTYYEYRVVVVNSVGSATSDWKLIFTPEGKPGSVSPPQIQNVTSRDAIVFQEPPARPNGEILNYTLFLNGKQKLVSSQSQFILTGLSPATKYIIMATVCNMRACVSGKNVEFTTKSEPPQGFPIMTVLNLTSDSLHVSWHEPSRNNGFNLSYQLSHRTSCPLPYSTDVNNQPLGYNCNDGPFLVGYHGISRETSLTNLIPYTKYNLQLLCCNEAGCSQEETTIDITTMIDGPRYRFGHPPIIQLRQNYLSFNWEESFYPNGPIKSFSFFKEGILQFSGSSLTFVDYIRDTNADHLYKISLVTDVGSVTSPGLLYVPNASHLKEINTTNTVAEDITVTWTQESFKQSKQFYHEKWFIILISVPAAGIFIVILFLIIFCCVKRKQRNSSEGGAKNSSTAATRKSTLTRRASTSSTNGLVYQVPIDFQEYSSPAFSDDWSSEVSSTSAANSPAKNNSYGKPQELEPWKYLKDENEERQTNAGNPQFSPTSSSGASLTVAEVIASNPGQRKNAEPLPKWNENADRLHIPDVTMPGVDESEDDSGLQSFVEDIIFKDSRGTSKLPDSKI